MKRRPLVRSLVLLAALLVAPLAFHGIKELGIWNMTRNSPRLTDSEVRERVQAGMSKDAVLGQLGEPKSKGDGGAIWTYLNRNPNPSEQVSHGFVIQFESDLVARVRFGSPEAKE